MITHLSRTSEIRIGSGELLFAFFEEALRIRVRRLLMLTPYVDDSAFAQQPFQSLWQRTIAMADSTIIIVRTPAAADAILRSTQSVRQRCNVHINPRLHAKVFLGWCPETDLALVGSQNLTGAALHVNKEIGLLIKPSGSEMKAAVSQLRAALGTIVNASSLYVRRRICPSGDGSQSWGNGLKDSG